MITSRVEDFTLSELHKVCQERSDEAYRKYMEAIHEANEGVTDLLYKKWTHAEDCLYAINRVLEMVKTEV